MNGKAFVAKLLAVRNDNMSGTEEKLHNLIDAIIEQVHVDAPPVPKEVETPKEVEVPTDVPQTDAPPAAAQPDPAPTPAADKP